MISIGNNTASSEGSIESFGEFVKNANGKMIVDFHIMNNLIPGNTIFEQK